MKKQAFTLVEILVAMVVVVVLIGMVMGGGMAAAQMAKANRTRTQIVGVETALEQYRIYWGFYPESQSTVTPMTLNKAWWDSIGSITYTTDSNNDGVPDFTQKKYLIDNTTMGMNVDATGSYVDPYGNPFYYQNPGRMNKQKFDLWSTGRDGKHGEATVDDDGGGTVDDYLDAQSINAKDSDDLTNWSR